MPDNLDESDVSLPPATLTPTYYDRLAAEIMEDLDRVAAKFPKLEIRHRATANARRAHLNVPRPFLGTAVAVTEEIPEIEQSGSSIPPTAARRFKRSRKTRPAAEETAE